jgi:predicted dithiol-disulfide oxidoreductase (DUF899 family)
LFEDGKDTLVLYSFMFLPGETGRADIACPACTSIIDALDGQAPHLTQLINLAVAAKVPIEQFREHAGTRGWRNIRLLSAANNFNGDLDLVFAHPQTGKPLDRSKVLKRFKAACKDAKVPVIRFHDLRHTFGTRLAASGVPLRTIQEFMGHADTKTTQIYVHYARSEHEIQLVDDAFASEQISPGDTPATGSEPPPTT